MSEKQKSRRGLKKEIVRRFETQFDVVRLNYVRRSKSSKPKSALIGLLTAGGLYSAGFFLAFMAVENNTLPLDMFAKLVWMMMVPTTIVGFLAWQISKNRMEYPVRRDVREYMAELEKDGGLLWRYFPIFDALDPKHADLKKAFIWSEEGRAEKLSVEEYCDAVIALSNLFKDGDAREFTVSMLEQTAINLGMDPNKL